MNKMGAHGVARTLGGVLAILMVLQSAKAQTVHVVGDDLGWVVPQDTSAYQNWASGKNFAVGDILTFNFATNRHDVVEVASESYTSCSSANTIGTPISTGPANITLQRGGQHFYICTFGTHCVNGQKLAINVTGSPSPSALPPSSATSPSGTPATPTPPSPSSASTTSFPNLLLFFVFIVMAF